MASLLSSRGKETRIKNSHFCLTSEKREGPEKPWREESAGCLLQNHAFVLTANLLEGYQLCSFPWN